MCNLYSMTATVHEMRRVFGPFEGDRDNLPSIGDIYPGRQAPVLRQNGSVGLKLEIMTWGFPGPQAGNGRPVTNVRNLSSPFWRSAALKDPAPR
jgi:putative SOS response-associated peptidase YedK